MFRSYSFVVLLPIIFLPSVSCCLAESRDPTNTAPNLPQLWWEIMRDLRQAMAGLHPALAWHVARQTFGPDSPHVQRLDHWVQHHMAFLQSTIPLNVLTLRWLRIMALQQGYEDVVGTTVQQVYERAIAQLIRESIGTAPPPSPNMTSV
jgi:hypothetical protein